MANLLDKIQPMTLDERPLDFTEPGWIYEVNYDGWRLMAEFGDGACMLKTRDGAIATTWFPEVSESLARVKGGPYVVDGEVCVLDELGRSNFDRLQYRGRKRRWRASWPNVRKVHIRRAHEAAIGSRWSARTQGRLNASGGSHPLGARRSDVSGRGAASTA